MKRCVTHQQHARTGNALSGTKPAPPPLPTRLLGGGAGAHHQALRLHQPPLAQQLQAAPEALHLAAGHAELEAVQAGAAQQLVQRAAGGDGCGFVVGALLCAGGRGGINSCRACCKRSCLPLLAGDGGLEELLSSCSNRSAYAVRQTPPQHAASLGAVREWPAISQAALGNPSTMAEPAPGSLT